MLHAPVVDELLADLSCGGPVEVQVAQQQQQHWHVQDGEGDQANLVTSQALLLGVGGQGGGELTLVYDD